MGEEAPVLIGDQHVEEARVDIVERNPEPPRPLRRRQRPQQRPVAGDDFRRCRRRIERRRKGAVERAEPDHRGRAGESGDAERKKSLLQPHRIFSDRPRRASSACRQPSRASDTAIAHEDSCSCVIPAKGAKRPPSRDPLAARS
jgi:hypothetical protein